MRYLLYAIFLCLVAGTCSGDDDLCDKSSWQECTNVNTGGGSELCRWCPLSRSCHVANDRQETPCPVELDIDEASECPPDVIQDEFNATAAYHKALLTSVSYSEYPDLCLEKIQELEPLFDYEIMNDNFIAERCDDFIFDYNVCVAMVTVSHSNREIVLSYRGTTQTKQLVDEVLTALFLKKLNFYNHGNVQQYFLKAFNKLRPCVMDRLKATINMFPDYRVTVNGHSLGGAMASIMSMYIKVNKTVLKDKMSLFTFGQPRTGDKTFAVAHDRLVPHSWRIVHHMDIVSHVPLCHPHCDDGDVTTNYHHGVEIFYDSKSMADHSEFTVCQANHDNSCSRKYTKLHSSFIKKFKENIKLLTQPLWLMLGYGTDFIEDHRMYYNIPLGSYCDSLLGVDRRRKRSIGDAFHDGLRDDTCTTLYLNSTTDAWTPSDPALPYTPKPKPTAVSSSSTLNISLICHGLFLIVGSIRFLFNIHF